MTRPQLGERVGRNSRGVDLGHAQLYRGAMEPVLANTSARRLFERRFKVPVLSDYVLPGPKSKLEGTLEPRAKLLRENRRTLRSKSPLSLPDLRLSRHDDPDFSECRTPATVSPDHSRAAPVDRARSTLTATLASP